jgi:hypothetical protein
MFYVFNVQQWLGEVVDACRENHLDPEDSIFALVMFSSLDFDFVRFFRERKPQISQYSGDNVHLFTPMIYDEDVVPDGEWRSVREGFSNAGIPLSNRPSVILFHLCKRPEATGFDPHYVAAFELPPFSRFETKLRDFVDACIAHRKNDSRLTRELATLFATPNRIQHVLGDTPLSGWPISDVLHAPRVFISYTHADKDTVLDIYNSLKGDHVKLWLDQFEIVPGDRIRESVEQGLRKSDALLMVLSSHSKESNWVSFEGSLFHGQGANKPIIPVVIDDGGKNLANRLPFLQDRLYVDLTNPKRKREAIKELAEAIGKLKSG